MTDHIDEARLESYVLGRLVASELGDVEEHVLICEECRNRAEGLDSFIAGLCAANELLNSEPLRMTHLTTDGPIRLRVDNAAAGGWNASFSGRQLEGGRWFPELREANEYLLKTFAELFPEHACGKDCDHGCA